jgi:hypothetical protein
MAQVTMEISIERRAWRHFGIVGLAFACLAMKIGAPVEWFFRFEVLSE